MVLIQRLWKKLLIVVSASLAHVFAFTSCGNNSPFYVAIKAGDPEIKGQIRRRPHEILNNKMMSKVKDADLVITNPTHFAVALSYDSMGNGAPLLVAKGEDGLVARIR